MNHPRFIVDNNVGRLAVWLRVLGYDTIFINPIADSELLEIAQREQRVVLTKDTGIMQRRLVASGTIEAYLVKGSDWRAQLAQVMKAYRLDASGQFTRCVRCNGVLEARDKEAVRQHVPPMVYRIQEEFFACPGCGRHYWQGSHWQRMSRAVHHILQHRSALAGEAAG
ncbi:MAG TPA: Mut7-C RNAse domain-containing protein [Candidatus Obscuribacterales bacterium]